MTEPNTDESYCHEFENSGLNITCNTTLPENESILVSDCKEHILPRELCTEKRAHDDELFTKNTCQNLAIESSSHSKINDLFTERFETKNAEMSTGSFCKNVGVSSIIEKENSPCNGINKSSDKKLVKFLQIPSLANGLLNSQKSGGLLKAANKFKHNKHRSKSLIEVRQQSCKLENEITVMKRVTKIRENKKIEKLDRLILKWRETAQMCTHYLMNEANKKIDQMGGIIEYRKREKQTKKTKMKLNFDDDKIHQLESFMQSEEYKNLDNYDKKEILRQKQQIEEMSNKIDDDPDNNDFSNLFTMKELCTQLKQDYQLIWGNME